MKVGEARAAAAEWVRDNAAQFEGYHGAFFSGSTTWLPDDAELPPASDVDVLVAVRGDGAPPKLGKFRHRGALLEVSYLPDTLLASAEDVLAAYHLAGCFRVDTVIDDPTGQLRALQAQVGRQFAEPAWVRRRYEDAMHRVELMLDAQDVTLPLHDSVTRSIFPAGVTTHVLLAAGQRNPTVRLRYLAVRGLLAEYDRLDLYEDLLRLLGCADVSAARVQGHLDAMAATFDATAPVSRTPFGFSADITAEARAVAVGGSQELVDAGNHREAVFWIVATFARCHMILAADAPQRGRELAPSFQAAAADLVGLTSRADLTRRGEQVRRFLPRLRREAESLLSAARGPARCARGAEPVSDATLNPWGPQP